MGAVGNISLHYPLAYQKWLEQDVESNGINLNRLATDLTVEKGVLLLETK
jgi:hypothetical protein